VTLLPFLADPKRFIVLKPSMTKTAAERLFFDLAYDSRPNWTTYDRTLAFATSLRELLKPHEHPRVLCRRLMVQSDAGTIRPQAFLRLRESGAATGVWDSNG
jgi:hypothetical protein